MSDHQTTASPQGEGAATSEAVDDFFAAFGITGFDPAAADSESEPDPSDPAEDDEEDPLAQPPAKPELSERSKALPLAHLAADTSLFARRIVPPVDIGAQPNGLCTVFAAALSDPAHDKALSGVVATLQLADRTKFLIKGAEFNFAMTDIMLKYETGMELPSPSELDDDVITATENKIKSCEAIQGNMVDEHIEELGEDVTKEEIEKEVARYAQLARDGKAAVWGSAAHGRLQADTRRRQAARTDWTRDLNYTLFHCDTTALLSQMSPPMEIAAKLEVPVGADGLCVAVLDAYPTMSCHADAERMLNLVGTGEGRTESTTEAGGPQAWKAAMRGLRNHLSGHSRVIYRVKFPGHSMCLIQLDATVDFYESVAGRGVGDCIMTQLLREKRAKRSIAVAEMVAGLDKLLICDTLDRDNDPDFSRGGHLLRAFGMSDGALSVPREGDFDFRWDAAPLEEPQGIADKIQEETQRSVALIDFLGRAPFKGDTRPFLVCCAEEHWTITSRDGGAAISVSAVRVGGDYRFTMDGGGATACAADGRVTDEIFAPDGSGRRVAFTVTPVG